MTLYFLCFGPDEPIMGGHLFEASDDNQAVDTVFSFELFAPPNWMPPHARLCRVTGDVLCTVPVDLDAKKAELEAALDKRWQEYWDQKTKLQRELIFQEELLARGMGSQAAVDTASTALTELKEPEA